jgi:hypothetical protein
MYCLQYEYFDQPGSLKHITLHAAADPARGRALYALHLPADHRCCVWVVNPARRGQAELSDAIAKKAWEEVAAAGDGGDPQVASQRRQVSEEAPPLFEVAYVRSQEAALKQLQKELGRIR